MNPIFTKMVDTVEAANAAPDDYINSADGLKYCGKWQVPHAERSLLSRRPSGTGLYHAPGDVQVR